MEGKKSHDQTPNPQNPQELDTAGIFISERMLMEGDFSLNNPRSELPTLDFHDPKYPNIQIHPDRQDGAPKTAPGDPKVTPFPPIPIHSGHIPGKASSKTHSTKGGGKSRTSGSSKETPGKGSWSVPSLILSYNPGILENFPRVFP